MTPRDITYPEKLNELMLDSSHPNNKNRVFIFVEGESDIRIFRKCFDAQICKVENIPGGNCKLEECTATIAQRHPYVFGIRDADFLHLDEQPYQKPHMFLTDFHDMEMSLVANDDVLAAVLMENAPLNNPVGTESAKQHALRNELMQVIEPISYLKWLNVLMNLKLVFAKTGFVDLINFSSLSFNFSEYFNRLIRNSPDAGIKDFTIIEQHITELRTLNPKPYYLCNGHDFMKILAAYIRDIWKGSGMSDDKMAGNFRLVFTKEHWQQTQLYAATQIWAQNQKWGGPQALRLTPYTHPQ